jgi:hypothetical protein
MSVKKVIDIELTNEVLNERVFGPIANANDRDISFISKDTKCQMKKYVENTKDQQTTAKTLWKDLLIDAICILKINDTREKLYIDARKWKKEGTFSEKFNKVRTISSYGIDDLSNYFKDFVEYESVLFGTDKQYRDHVLHLLQVWAIGIGILFQKIKQFNFGESVVYSERWTNSRWYTYWHASGGRTRDTQLFDICSIAMFSYKELSTNIEQCLQEIRKLIPDVTEKEIQELKEYVQCFLRDVNSAKGLIYYENLQDGRGFFKMVPIMRL